MKAAPSAVASTRLWVQRMVIGLSLCPWAAPVQDRIRFACTPAKSADAVFSSLLREVELLQQGAEPETTILVAPDFERDDFTEFNAFVRDAEEYLCEEGLDAVVQLVAFHPRHVYGGDAADDPSSYASRSPHPTLHLLRQSSVTAAVDGSENSLEVPRLNAQTLRRMGSAALEAELRSCREAAGDTG